MAGDLLEVVAPGLLSTIQDVGRFDHRDEGVPVAGACDPVGLAVANAVLGNAMDAAAIECTILGPELLVLADTVVGLGGADLEITLEPGTRRLAPGRAHRVDAGDRLVSGTGPGIEGCRAYLAVRGGLDVPVVLGSRSTSLVGAFGGIEGRPLRAGDRLRALETPGGRADPTARWPGPLTPRPASAPLRVLPGLEGVAPAADGRRRAELARALFEARWRIAAASDRRGLRLEGPSIQIAAHRDARPGPRPAAAAAASHGVLPGTIQLTPSGQPLILLNDAGTTGGYPVIGVVIAADLWQLGQARPGSWIEFQATTVAIARASAAAQRDWLGAAAERILAASDDAWDDLADDARG